MRIWTSVWRVDSGTCSNRFRRYRSTDIGDLDLLLTLYQLKEETRTGWLLRGVTDPESVADHSWATAMLCFMYAEPAGVDRNHAVAMALVHDLAESVTGDIATRVHDADRTVSVTDKQQRERTAMDGLFPRTCGNTGGGERGGNAALRELWDEYEAAATATARFVRDMNLVDMCLQALRYQREHRYDRETRYHNSGDYSRMDEFFATAGPRISTASGRKLYDEVYGAYGRLCAQDRGVVDNPAQNQYPNRRQ